MRARDLSQGYIDDKALTEDALAGCEILVKIVIEDPGEQLLRPLRGAR